MCCKLSAVWILVIGAGCVVASRFQDLKITTPGSSYSSADSSAGSVAHPGECSAPEGAHTQCRCPVINGTRTLQCRCEAGYVGTSPDCRPSPELLVKCFLGEPCGPNSGCKILQNGTRECWCSYGYTGSPPHCVAEKAVSECSEVNKCGPNSECVHYKSSCYCLPGFVGKPPHCTAGPRLLAQCDPYPCGAHSECRLRDNAPVCSCLPGYEGTPPHCRPGYELWLLCYSRRSCGFNSYCNVTNLLTTCSCFEGANGRPPKCWFKT